MKKIAQSFKEEIIQKEQDLSNTQQAHQRIELIQDIAHYYTYTSPVIAKKYLEELYDLSTNHNNTTALAHYHLFSAHVENQAYQYHTALSHLKQAEHIFKEEGFTTHLVEVYLNLGGIYCNLNMIEEAESWTEKAEQTQTELSENNSIKARLLNSKAVLYNRKFTYDKALQMLLAAHDLLKNQDHSLSLQDYHSLAQIYSNLGFSYMRVEDNKNSITIYKKMIKICEKFGFGTRLAWYYLHLGNAYRVLGKLKKAKLFFQKVITDSPQDTSQYARAGASANLGQLYEMQGNYNDALSMYDYAEQLYQQNSGADDDYNFSILERYRAQLYLGLDKRKKALAHYKKALQHAQRSNDYSQIAALYRDLAEFCEENKNFKKAYYYQIQYSEMRDRYVNKEGTRAITELKVKYKAEKKEQEAEFFRLQAKALQLKALKAQMNPHFIFNSLNSIQAYITGGESERAASFFSKFSRLIRNSLEFSEFNVIPLEDEIRFLKDYLALEKERFKGDFDFTISIADPVEEDITGIPPMVIQPYIENAIKHGIRGVKKGIVRVSFLLENEENLLCTIEDNGIGRTAAQQYQSATHRSMGTTITQQRLELFNQSSNIQLSTQTIDIEDEQGNALGTKVEVRIPVMDIDKKFYFA